MKNIGYLSLIIIVLISCSTSQNNTPLSDSKEKMPQKYLARRDSILKESAMGCIYITKDTTAEMYSWLSDESIDTVIFNELFSAQNIDNFLSDNKIRMKHFKELKAKGNWVSLYTLNDNFYVYSPSDWMVNKRIMITDSALYHFGSDDWRIESIQNISEDANGNLMLKLVGIDKEKIDLSIKFINDNKSVTLWNRKSSEGYEYSEWRVLSSEVRKYDMIVNDCLGVKCIQEFSFDAPRSID